MPTKVLSLYEGFFAGGARQLHTTVVAGLHQLGAQQHSVLSIHSEVFREASLQRMEGDTRYRMLQQAGVPVATLGRGSEPRDAFTGKELEIARKAFASTDVVFSLKEQPLRLLNHPELPKKPVVAALHRSDPENSGSALDELLTAVASGRLSKVVCCAEATAAAYGKAGVPSELLTVVPNGVDLQKFRPATVEGRALKRLELGLPLGARIIVYAARFDEMKNPELFLKAAQVLLAEDASTHVVMCGGGMTRDNAGLQAMLDATFAGCAELLDRVHTLGIRQDMPGIYGAADVVALTSLFGEAAPLCLIEGAMCGAVPVTTPVGDSALIVDGIGYVTGYDPVEIAATWQEAACRREESASALLAARSRFDHLVMLQRYGNVLEQAARVRTLAAA